MDGGALSPKDGRASIENGNEVCSWERCYSSLFEPFAQTLRRKDTLMRKLNRFPARSGQLNALLNRNGSHAGFNVDDGIIVSDGTPVANGVQPFGRQMQAQSALLYGDGTAFIR